MCIVYMFGESISVYLGGDPGILSGFWVRQRASEEVMWRV